MFDATKFLDHFRLFFFSRSCDSPTKKWKIDKEKKCREREREAKEKNVVVLRSFKMHGEFTWNVLRELDFSFMFFFRCSVLLLLSCCEYESYSYSFSLPFILRNLLMKI